jgi:hypothetical protein
MVFYHNSTNFDATLLFPYTWDKIKMDVHTCFVYFTILALLDVVCDNLCAFNKSFLVMVVCVPITNGWNQWHKWIATWIKLTKWWDFTICRWYYIHGKWYHQFILVCTRCIMHPWPPPRRYLLLLQRLLWMLPGAAGQTSSKKT